MNTQMNTQSNTSTTPNVHIPNGLIIEFLDWKLAKGYEKKLSHLMTNIHQCERDLAKAKRNGSAMSVSIEQANLNAAKATYATVSNKLAATFMSLYKTGYFNQHPVTPAELEKAVSELAAK